MGKQSSLDDGAQTDKGDLLCISLPWWANKLPKKSLELLFILMREMPYNFPFAKEKMLLERAHCNCLLSNVYLQAMLNILWFYFKKSNISTSFWKMQNTVDSLGHRDPALRNSDSVLCLLSVAHSIWRTLPVFLEWNALFPKQQPYFIPLLLNSTPSSLQPIQPALFLHKPHLHLIYL